MRVLIVRLGALGDIIHAAPVAAAIRAARPEASIDWVVDAKHAGVLDLLEGLDRVVVWQGPLVRGERGVLATLATLRAARYDVALDLQGLLKSAVLARLTGAARVVGFAASSLREPAARWFHSEHVVTKDDGHVVEKNLSMLAALGLPPVAAPVRFTTRTSPAIVAFLASWTGASRFAVLNPGAGWPNKQWPVARFGSVAAELQRRFGMRSCVTWGPGEQKVADEVVAASAGTAVVAPATQLSDYLELVRRASLVVAGDTGPMHMAAAVGARVVGLFGPTSEVRNGPYGMPHAAQVSRFGECGCRYARQCVTGGRCIERIEVPDVLRAVQRALQEGRECG